MNRPRLFFPPPTSSLPNIYIKLYTIDPIPSYHSPKALIEIHWRLFATKRLLLLLATKSNRRQKLANWIDQKCIENFVFRTCCVFHATTRSAGRGTSTITDTKRNENVQSCVCNRFQHRHQSTKTSLVFSSDSIECVFVGGDFLLLLLLLLLYWTTRADFSSKRLSASSRRPVHAHIQSASLFSYRWYIFIW